MNLEKWNQFQRVVLKLIKSGNPELKDDEIKEVKTLCKKELVAIPDVFDLLLKHLHSNHCQIRLSTFQIIDQLFQRSHAIRELVLEKLKTIVSLTLALELSEDLPPPSKFHDHLKKCAIKSIDSWNDKFGQHYSKLKVSYNFLVTKKNVDLKKLIARTHFEQQKEEKRLEQEIKMSAYVVMKTLAEYEEQVESFEDCLFEVHTCFDLLESQADGSTENKSNSIVANKTNKKKRVFSIINVDETVLQILETPDNASVIQSLDDRIHQAKHSSIPRIDKWIEELIRNNGEQKDVLPLIKSKEKLAKICESYNALQITRTSKRKRRIVQKDKNDSDESDFDEVDEDEVLNKIPEQKRLQISMAVDKSNTKSKDNRLNSKECVETKENFVDDDEMPCSSASLSNSPGSVIAKGKTSVIANGKTHLECKRKMANVLKEQEAESEESEMALHNYALVRFESLHRFWAAKDVEPEEMDINTVRALNPKYCNVPGKFEPVVWSCRAVIKAGRLCPRMDRFKCPLHGKVIPRDKIGKPNGKGLFPKSENLSSKGETWKEVEQEIEKQTGEKLNYSKIKKQKEAKQSNLVSIAKETQVTPRTRIEKKILSKKSIRSTNANANKIDTNRAKSAFDQQFNYALN